MKQLYPMLMACAALFSHSVVEASEEPPAWAYPMNPPGFKPAPDDGAPRRVPGSAATYTLTQVRDLFSAPDWHPNDRPPMPEIVAQGRRPAVQACGVCHRVEGTGGPENASLAGLPADYIIQQLQDYRSGARKTAVPARVPARLMMALSQHLTQADMEQSARYFASLPPRRNIRVRETDAVVKTQVTAWHLLPVKEGASEPLGPRIIELPDNVDQFISRDPRVTFTAYVPVGSIERGRALAAGGLGAKTVACATCHGTDLRGVGNVPSIAGRSPTYAFRQLYEFKHGQRNGAMAALMRPTVEALTTDDMIALAAYAGSLAP